MQPVSELRRREVETYLEVVADRGADVGVEGFAFHNLGVFDDSDYAHLLGVLEGAEAGASFAFLGRDADDRAGSIERIDVAGHEVALHGQRHVACGDLPESVARENVEAGVASMEAAAGVTPEAFFAPLLSMNAATMEALADAGIGRAVGRTDATVPDGLTVVEPEPIVDLELLMAGRSPAETFEELADRAESGGVFLMHPNLIEGYDATAEFEAWIDEFRPVSVGEWLEQGGTGLLVDAARPLKIE